MKTDNVWIKLFELVMSIKFAKTFWTIHQVFVTNIKVKSNSISILKTTFRVLISLLIFLSINGNIVQNNVRNRTRKKVNRTQSRFTARDRPVAFHATRCQFANFLLATCALEIKNNKFTLSLSTLKTPAANKRDYI